MTGGIELYRDLLLDTMVAVTRGILPGHRAPMVTVGIELDHQVLLLDTPVTVTRGMRISWVLPATFPRAPPMGTVQTLDRLSFKRSGLPTFADVHQGFAHVLRMFADVCRRPPREGKLGSCIELDHQVLLDTMVAVTRGILPSHRAPTVAGGRFPTTGFLLPFSYYRFPTSRTHCERISERIANA